jgi:hypothetical protein
MAASRGARCAGLGEHEWGRSSQIGRIGRSEGLCLGGSQRVESERERGRGRGREGEERTKAWWCLVPRVAIARLLDPWAGLLWLPTQQRAPTTRGTQVLGVLFRAGSIRWGSAAPCGASSSSYMLLAMGAGDAGGVEGSWVGKAASGDRSESWRGQQYVRTS